MSTKKSVVFLGSKPVGYECLRHLIAQKDALGLEIKGVLTQLRKEFGAERDVAALALAAGIPIVESPEEIPDCDVLYSVQYHKILKKEAIAKAGLAAVNLHMAPLPEYRGSNQFSYALIEGKEEFGVTIHLIDERIDHGDILFQNRFPIPHSCWIGELYEITEAAAVALFKESLAHVVSGNFTPVAQKVFEAEKGAALHFRDEINTLKQIDLNWDAGKIERHIRATSMPGFEPPYVLVGGEKVYFSRAIL